MTATIFLGLSLDGFIAREDGNLDWLIDNADDPTSGTGEDYGYRAFFDAVDGLVMGRATYDVVRGMGGWHYGKKPVVVLTRRPLDIPEELADTVETMAGSPREIAENLEARGWKHIYVDGGRTIQAFLADGLIDRMILSRLPVLIGTGIPLFGPVPEDIKLRHVATRTYDGGMVQSEYEVMRPDGGALR